MMDAGAVLVNASAASARQPLAGAMQGGNMVGEQVTRCTTSGLSRKKAGLRRARL